MSYKTRVANELRLLWREGSRQERRTIASESVQDDSPNAAQSREDAVGWVGQIGLIEQVAGLL